MSLKKKLKKLLSASEHKKEAEQEAHGLQHHAPAEEPQPETGESVPFQNEALTGAASGAPPVPAL